MAKYLFLISSLLLVWVTTSIAHYEKQNAVTSSQNLKEPSTHKEGDMGSIKPKPQKESSPKKYTDEELKKVRISSSKMGTTTPLPGLIEVACYLFFIGSGLAWLLSFLRQRRAEKKRSQRTDHE